MKTRLLIRLAAALLLGPVMATGPGCATTEQRAVYNTLYSVEQGVTAAFDAYLDGVIRGEIGRATVPEVSRRYNQFQATLQASVSLASYNWNAVAPESLVTLANEVLSAILEATEKGAGTP